MTKFFPALLCLFSGWLFFACRQDNPSAESPVTTSAPVDSATIDRHLTELASDRYGGRLPFSEGEGLTLAYLEKELKALGLQPGNGDSYRQEVPMVEITGHPAERIDLTLPNGDLTWRLGADYITFTDKPVERVSVTDSEVIFAGFGIVAPEYGWNDYDGLDVKGKTVVVMVNDPGYYLEDTTLFKGNAMTYYGRYTYKYEEAARQGAAACLVIHEQGAAGYPWFVVQSSWTGERLNLEDDGQPKLDVAGWITLDAARQLFQASGLTGIRWFEEAASPDFEPIPLRTQLTTTVRNDLRFDKSYNIMATLPGADRPEEHLIYTAHWDHIGVGPAVNGDSIYNGALDNASGVAQLLAMAEAFTKLPKGPERSVDFLFVTAEEQGLWGSAYYVNNPLVPIDKTVANINIDGVNPIGPAADLTITGMGHSEMDDLAATAAERQGRYVQGGQEPEKGYFYRSDHFNFAKKGVPVLYADGGYEHATLGKEYARQQKDAFVAQRYHQPADEYSSGAWPLGGAVQDAELMMDVGLQLANSERWPAWRRTSEFYVDRQ
ncbi:Zn-dependent M28 family amino/carboxypeptidase [Neolewinella xylanilytica]|uniref:Zn-dependent M28 family amino/carboxypeptidase n=1 Tax=Neolewinella xylanilytica TaxID=1514080 RepID=A0A2S6I9J4_9BACT|nr:M28 family metallopeptidase [Neolewinella xylanilytica]PPK88139.1 Zn-dependent M28 family amino/carboxypeptidase [Neolewinella xylanilytica]